MVDYVLKRTGTCARSGAPGVTELGDEGPRYITEQDVEIERKTRAKPEDIELAEHGKVDLGIDNLISEKVFIAAYPLHEVNGLLT